MHIYLTRSDEVFRVHLNATIPSQYTACSTRFEVFGLCANIAQPQHKGRVYSSCHVKPLQLSVPLIACTLYVHMCVYMCVFEPMEDHTVLATIHHSWLLALYIHIWQVQWR